jgi:5-methyltetrahydropteroyltriglutamate--homocysteine methyltransferase
MQKSDGQILTTHTGSLPRSRELVDLVMRRLGGDEVDPAAFREAAERDMAEVVARQLHAGIAIGGDGEAPRPGFASYISGRMSGFGGVSNRKTLTDFHNFPGYAALKAGEPDELFVDQANFFVVPAAQHEVHYDDDLAAVREELDLFATTLEAAHGRFAETFVTAASPGIVSTMHVQDDEHPPYATDEDYVFALAEELRKEYAYIVEQGHLLQLDCPDLAMERFIMFGDRPVGEFLARVEVHIEAINRAIVDLPPERVRLHVCWGNIDSPHTDDPALGEIVDLLYRANVGALSLPLANPRHAHEWRQLAATPPPGDMLLIAGVIDSTTNYVEHPDLVADRVCQVAEALGDPTRVIAGVDCGFETWAGQHMVAHDVVWAKLDALTEGAQRATKRLFG